MGKKLTIKDCYILAEKKGGECLAINYTNNATKIKRKCACGNIWKACYGSIRSENWCTK